METGRGRRAVVVLGMLAVVSGCRREGEAKPAGSDLPVTSSRSVALPGATDAADAPRAPQVAESRAANLTTYRDPASGVSFDYPSVWRPSIAGQGARAPFFEQNAGTPRITQEFRPERTYYAPTVLQSLTFSYTVKPVKDVAQCAGLATGALQDGQSKQAVYGGRTYTEMGGSDAGACTHVTAQVDSTLVGKRCFVFERDFVTICPYVKSQTEPRPLTAQEIAALQRHLDEVMGSVRIEDAAAK